MIDLKKNVIAFESKVLKNIQLKVILELNRRRMIY